MRRPELVNAWELRQMLREAVKALGSQSQWAEQHGVSKQYLSHVLHGRTVPSPKICEALGYQRVVMFERKDRPGGPRHAPR